MYLFVIFFSLFSPSFRQRGHRDHGGKDCDRKNNPGTSTRQKLYLLEDVLADKLPAKKLPKNKHVLKRFIEVYDDKVKDANAMRPKDKCAVAKEASKVISEELKEVWSLHFGIFVVYGRWKMRKTLLSRLS